MARLFTHCCKHIQVGNTMSHCAGCCNVLAQSGRQRGGDKRFQISVKSPVEIKPAYSQRAAVDSVTEWWACSLARMREPTFSRSCRSWRPLASLEHRFCSGATTVQMQRPSASWVELYTCHPSFGRMVCIQEEGGSDQNAKKLQRQLHHDNGTVATLPHQTSSFILLDDQTLCLV